MVKIIPITKAGKRRYGIFKVYTPVGYRYNVVTKKGAIVGYKTKAGAIKGYKKLKEVV